MATVNTVPGSRGENRGLTYWMERVLKELDKVRTAPDPDAVHDLRVALRRCRSVATVMEEVDADPSWPEMRKLGRKIFRQLGELRDTQVLEDWVKNLGQENDPIRERVLGNLSTREGELRDTALRVAAKFDEKAWKKLERTLRSRSRLVPPDRLAAECLALERLEAAKELHAQALRTEKPTAWHELRIGVKRFRYTVESLLPARYEVWGDDLKRLQDLLGDVHDLDVLAAAANENGATESDELHTAWAERIASERHHRIETYRQLTLGKTSLWQTWRQGLPNGNRLQAAAMARLRATAKALDGHSQRITQVSQLAMKLFDGLARVEAAPMFATKGARKLLRAAARLHGIGSGLDEKHPQKAARDYLREMPVPMGWTPEEWELLSSIVRYHRGALPDAKHKAFARLGEEDQKTVSALAGILRLARVLRKCGVTSAIGLQVEKSVDALIVQVPGLEESEEAAARLAAGKYLLENVLGKPVITKHAPAPPKIVELPRREESPVQDTAAASD
jgi:CHAD domain-containing protein